MAFKSSACVGLYMMGQVQVPGHPLNDYAILVGRRTTQTQETCQGYFPGTSNRSSQLREKTPDHEVSTPSTRENPNSTDE